MQFMKRIRVQSLNQRNSKNMHNRADEIGTDGVNQDPSDVENWDLIRTQLIELPDLDEIIIKYSLILFFVHTVCTHT